MMNLFKRTKLADERVLNLKNIIYAEIYIIVTILCSISFITKFYVFNTGIEGIYTELAILVISGVYYVFRATKLGVVSAEIELHDSKNKWSRRKKNLFLALILGLAISLTFGINSAVQYGEGMGQSIYYFFLTTFVSLMIYLPVFLITWVIGSDALKKKSDDAVDKMLSENESGDSDEEY